MIEGWNRRAFVRNGALWLGGLGMNSVELMAESKSEPLIRAGLLTDIHYAEKEAKGTRFYRDSLAKMQQAVQHFNRSEACFVVELGDMIDQSEDHDTEVKWLQTIEAAYAELKCPRRYVLGNHCVTNITKFEFASLTRAPARSFHKFEVGGVTFLILDACFKQNGEAYLRNNFDWRDCAIPPLELRWLKVQLDKAAGPVVVFVHQRLDEKPSYQVHNAAEVRKILEDSKKVSAVFQGHSHKNDYQEIGGIHYVTLAGMIEGAGPDSTSYSDLLIHGNGQIQVTGFKNQASYDLKGKLAIPSKL